MSRYVDGFVLPIQKKNLARYRRVARVAGKVWREHGALEYVECVADQLTTKHEGKTYTSLFPKLARVKPGEVVVFAWIVYKSKADQKRVMKKVMADTRIAKAMDPNNMPFDMSRMASAGFKPIVEAYERETRNRPGAKANIHLPDRDIPTDPVAPSPAQFRGER